MANNILQQVQTYNESNLALLLNSFAFISTSNKKFQRFNDDIPKNLGDTVTFDLPPRFTTKNSLVASFQSAEQRVHSLKVDQQASTAYDFTAQQFIFNVRDYMDKFGRSAVAEIGTRVEADIASLAESNTYRFYGDGVTKVSSYLQLASALAFFRNYGAAKDNVKGYLSDLTYPAIVNSGLNQFALDRNNKEAMSWEVGRFSNCEWYQSNLLKTHVAGTCGRLGLTLEVETLIPSSTDPNQIVAITFSGCNSSGDPVAVRKYDKFQFNDGVGSLPNVRFKTFIGHEDSQSPVQFAATEDCQSFLFGPGDFRVTVPMNPPLQWASGRNQNVSSAIQVGMQVSVLPDHRCGLIVGGSPLYVAMPKLPDESPYATSAITDPDSGCSLRSYYGSLFGQNQRGFVHDVIWGKTLVPEYSMMIALPV